MRRIVSAYTVSPDDIRPGDEMAFIVKAMVFRRDGDGKLLYRIYRCNWEGDEMPQGAQVADMENVCKSLFPSLAAIGKPD